MTSLSLFGLVGAEHMHDDLESVYESEIEPFDDSNGPWTIEQWTSHPVTFHPYYAENCAEDACETLCDELGEDPDGRIHEAASSPEVVAAFRSALDLLASKVEYRMADEHVMTWTLTIDDDGDLRYTGVRVDTKEDTP